MSWRTQLRLSSFRGAEYHTYDRTGDGGRHLANHEYPKRDEPFAEDMTRRQRRWSMVGYVIGADYMAARDRLIDALEKEGDGRYIDHWRGEMRASVETFSYRESSDEGGYCEFTINYVEPGENEAPSASVAAFAQIAGAAASLISAGQGMFKANYRG